MKKELKTWLVVDTRTGKFKLLSSKISLQSLKSKIKGTEVPISLTLNVEVPETPILKAFGEIKLSQTQISELMLSEIEEDDVEKKNE